MAGTNLLTSLLTTTTESARRVGVEQAVGFTPRQLIGQGASGRERRSVWLPWSWACPLDWCSSARSRTS